VGLLLWTNDPPENLQHSRGAAPVPLRVDNAKPAKSLGSYCRWHRVPFEICVAKNHVNAYLFSCASATRDRPSAFSNEMKKISACPSWLKLSEDRYSFVFVPDRAEIVRKIFELSIGGLGSYSIANHLDRQNVPPFGPSPKWDHTTIDSMLRNRATIGEHQPKSYAGGSKKGVPLGAAVPGYYPAVIDEATFQEAQAARQRNLATGRGRKGHNITNIFTGLTTCAYCASPVKFHSNGNSKSLICAQVLSGAGCIRVGWSYRNFESSVLHFLAHPALIEGLKDEKRKLMVELVGCVRQLPGPETYDARFRIASILKGALSELKLASAGSDPAPTLLGALIRRDNANRFFEIKLWDGPTYVGIPIEQ
jgi:hypothetical protein